MSTQTFHLLLRASEETEWRGFLEKRFPRIVVHTARTDQAFWKKLEEEPIDVVLCIYQGGMRRTLRLIEGVRQHPVYGHLPILVWDAVVFPFRIRLLREAGASNVYGAEEGRLGLQKRLSVQFNVQRRRSAAPSPVWRQRKATLRAKRTLDILTSGLALVLLSPLLALVALAIKLDSPGPVLYRSRRVGTGYRVFKLYKFRTMRVNADAQRKQLQTQNAYCEADAPRVKKQVVDPSLAKGALLVSDQGLVSEAAHQAGTEAGAPAFFKLVNDPRVTPLGRFLRNSSIDELPQLWNILQGDMSLVGNRPLPLYEAEKLTSDEAVGRFLGPAGLTGLWQVEKRGRSRSMSARERIQLDCTYAQQFSLAMDLKILLRTVPALLQKENV
jgi:lipopolysaccharide/colanic/teichoic acid biosynthesis glycosyltransferase